MYYPKNSPQRNLSFEGGRLGRNPRPVTDFDDDDLAALGVRFLRPNASRWYRQQRGDR
jgi:hypothetical protein